MRQERQNGTFKLVYGIDEIEGLFYEVYSYDGVLMESDSVENNPLLTMKVMASLVVPYGFDLSDEVPEEVIEIE